MGERSRFLATLGMTGAFVGDGGERRRKGTARFPSQKELRACRKRDLQRRWQDAGMVRAWGGVLRSSG